ncbi:MAG TPA: hypothetical protein VGN90_00615 [Pyrinomonadaceae bacterium]|nr:hypothetical protein [Pyrinomonadaceae bacterium]
MRRILLLTVTSIIFAGAALLLLGNRPSLTSKVMATQPGRSLKFQADPSPKHRFNSLQNLVERSPEIVVGVPVGKSSYRRSPQDRMVFTDFDIQVLKILKGDRHPDRKLTVRVPGGLLSQPDGRTTEVTLPDFWKTPEIGKGYIFFLTRRKDTASVLVGGPQGLFEIAPWPESVSMTALPDISKDHFVIPQVRETDELMKNYKGLDVASVLDQIKGMIATNKVAANKVAASKPASNTPASTAKSTSTPASKRLAGSR